MAYDKFAAVDSSTLLFPPSVRENLAGVSPNVIINGGFDIWQRGTSFSYGAPSTVYTADRWSITNAFGSGTPAFTISRQNSTLTSIQYSLRFQRNSGSTATTNGFLAYSLESVDSIRMAGKSVTLSFYARAGANYSPTSGALNYRIATGTGTDQNLNSTGFTGQINSNSTATLTTSWQRLSLTVDVPTNATQIGLQYFSAFTGTAGANDWFEITGVQLEESSVATSFRRNANSIQGELAACQRYYYRISGGFAHYLGLVRAHSTTAGNCMFTFKQTMRTVPVSLESASLELDNPGIGTISITATYGSLITGTDTASVSLTGSGLSTTATYYLRFSTTGHIAWSAEL